MVEHQILTGLVAEPAEAIIEIGPLGNQVRVAILCNGLEFAIVVDPDKLDEIAAAFTTAASQVLE